ncbi:MAG: DUF5320 domain-containing protein [Desulfitobacteriaceae bacterium]|nr:DUF5320 domain-containing protein [Desulfitobacteriaceae bacterium]MDD4347169.1 DUF5320 domain-containing protein [Desulfitobacteriaceae bacterium]MDD4401370.1 DUF5320 domain-containing protein [Desulfitobacteriaceae bacterium]
MPGRDGTGPMSAGSMMLWLSLIRMEVMNYGETDEVAKSLLLA